MARVSDDQVKQIIDTTIDTTPFIKAATLIIDDRLSDQGLDDELLLEIERWLSAHLVAIRSQDSVAKSEKTGNASITRHGQSGMGLDFTPYGQQVKILDPTGLLVDLGLKAASLETIDFLDSSL